MGKTYVFLPPLRRPTGGLAVLHQVAAALAAGGREVVLAPREAGHWQPGDTAHLPVAGWGSLALTPDDIWLTPEGWPNALAPGLNAQARCVVYVQNWAYLFSGLPEGVTWDRLPVSFVAVSDPVAWYIGRATGREAPVLRPGIDRTLFAPPEAKPEGPVRVAWMPRKNKAQGQQARAMLDARLAPGLAPDSGAPRLDGVAPKVEWVALEGLDQQGVAEALRSCHVFLATGFPEGCPLPPLEAMACGCLPVGCGGFGGWDYMRQAAAFDGAYEPWWPLRNTPFSGNGLWTADADVAAMVNALELAARWVVQGGPGLQETLAQGQATADAYALDAMAAQVAAVWGHLETSNQ